MSKLNKLETRFLKKNEEKIEVLSLCTLLTGTLNYSKIGTIKKYRGTWGFFIRWNVISISEENLKEIYDYIQILKNTEREYFKWRGKK